MGYTWLTKDEDYGAEAVDASYYALNFAKHRLNISWYQAVNNAIEIRVDGEARVQEKNLLRTSDETAFNGSVSLVWRPVALTDVQFELVGDNITDSDFQDFPGTPSAERQWSLRATYFW